MAALGFACALVLCCILWHQLESSQIYGLKEEVDNFVAKLKKKNIYNRKEVLFEVWADQSKD